VTTSQRITDVVLKAFEVCAASQGESVHPSISLEGRFHADLIQHIQLQQFHIRYWWKE
jgi:N-methylhydantoinase B/oxoprolinase/acetone carboxylase alpha subunit